MDADCKATESQIRRASYRKCTATYVAFIIHNHSRIIIFNKQSNIEREIHLPLLNSITWLKCRYTKTHFARVSLRELKVCCNIAQAVVSLIVNVFRNLDWQNMILQIFLYAAWLVKYRNVETRGKRAEGHLDRTASLLDTATAVAVVVWLQTEKRNPILWNWITYRQTS